MQREPSQKHLIVSEIVYENLKYICRLGNTGCDLCFMAGRCFLWISCFMKTQKFYNMKRDLKKEQHQSTKTKGVAPRVKGSVFFLTIPSHIYKANSRIQCIISSLSIQSWWRLPLVSPIEQTSMISVSKIVNSLLQELSN